MSGRASLSVGFTVSWQSLLNDIYTCALSKCSSYHWEFHNVHEHGRLGCQIACNPKNMSKAYNLESPNCYRFQLVRLYLHQGTFVKNLTWVFSSSKHRACLDRCRRSRLIVKNSTFAITLWVAVNSEHDVYKVYWQMCWYSRATLLKVTYSTDSWECSC